MKVLTTKQLTTLCLAAHAAGLSRVLETKELSALDPDGRHVVSGTVLLINDGGAIRVNVWMKLRGTMTPYVRPLDFGLAEYNAIPDHKE